jgi:hypothetical protein
MQTENLYRPKRVKPLHSHATRGLLTPVFSWRQVRARIWVKAEELFMAEQIQAFDCDITPERCELREGGYFDRAKLIVLGEVYLEGKSGSSF